jgi:hypothetical protein
LTTRSIKFWFRLLQNAYHCAAACQARCSAAQAGDPLDTDYALTREWMTFPNGAYVVEVEIDPAIRAR